MTSAKTIPTRMHSFEPRLLSLEEASSRLRFIPRLIIKCIKHVARPNGGIKLNCIDVGGEPCFSEMDLTAYDEDLRKHWVNNRKDRRPEIPEYFKTYLQCEAGMKCGLCNSPFSSEYAHIEPWEKCLHHHPHNLISLCTKCHTGYDGEQRIAKEIMQKAKDRMLKRLLVASNTEANAPYSESLAAICKIIAGLLDQNHLIFQNFGPASPLAESSFEHGADRIWKQRRKDTILPNNKRIAAMLNNYRSVYDFDVSFKTLADAFIAHEMSYEAFVEYPNKVHDNFRFPKGFAERVYKEAL